MIRRFLLAQLTKEQRESIYLEVHKKKCQEWYQKNKDRRKTKRKVVGANE